MSRLRRKALNAKDYMEYVAIHQLVNATTFRSKLE